MVGIARRILGEETAAALAATDDEAERALRFTTAWTAFEARQKLTGNGLFGDRRLPPHRLIHFHPGPGWVAALAQEWPAAPPRFLDYPLREGGEP